MGSIVAMIMAAGRSRRMGENKMLLPLKGGTVIGETLRLFDEVEGIDQILLVSSDQDLIEGFSPLKKEFLHCRGGEERMDSVRQGLSLLSEEDYVLIHDGARPFLSKEALLRCLDVARAGECFLLGVPVVDTIKVVEGEYVRYTPARENLIAAQTPQGAPVKLLRRAYEEAKEGFFTDDASLLEAIGIPVRVIPGEIGNLKITHREDLLRCE